MVVNYYPFKLTSAKKYNYYFIKGALTKSWLHSNKTIIRKKEELKSSNIKILL